MGKKRSAEIQWGMIPPISSFLTNILSIAQAAALAARTCTSKSCLMTLPRTYLNAERERASRLATRKGQMYYDYLGDARGNKTNDSYDNIETTDRCRQ